MATVKLTWTDNSTNETGFKLWKAYGTTAADYLDAADIITAGELGTGGEGEDDFITGPDTGELGEDDTEYDDTVSNVLNTHAFYVLKAYNGSGDSSAALTVALDEFLHVEVTH